MAANVSQGSLLKKGATTLGDITGISLGGISRAEIDVTTLSTGTSANYTKNYLMGTVDSGTIEVQFNYDDGLATYIPLGTETAAAAWSIVVPCGTTTTQTITFNSWQQSFSVEASVDSQLTGSLTLRIDGAVTFGSCT
jgi:hypothetical protein